VPNLAQTLQISISITISITAARVFKPGRSRLGDRARIVNAAALSVRPLRRASRREAQGSPHVRLGRDRDLIRCASTERR
jgi:hypothetical protein